MTDHKQHIEDLEKLLEMVRDQRREEVRKQLQRPSHTLIGNRGGVIALQEFAEAIKQAIGDEKAARPNTFTTTELKM